MGEYKEIINNTLYGWCNAAKNNPTEIKDIIHTLVEFLNDDMYWLVENISDRDKKMLIDLAGIFKNN